MDTVVRAVMWAYNPNHSPNLDASPNSISFKLVKSTQTGKTAAETARNTVSKEPKERSDPVTPTRIFTLVKGGGGGGGVGSDMVVGWACGQDMWFVLDYWVLIQKGKFATIPYNYMAVSSHALYGSKQSCLIRIKERQFLSAHRSPTLNYNCLGCCASFT